MSAVLDMAVPALALSSLATLALAMLGDAPPKARLAVAVGGLAAWVMPWPWIAGSLALSSASTDHGLLDSAARLSLAEQRFAAAAPPALEPYLACALGVLLGVGVALLAFDCARLRRSLREWRRASRPAEELRAMLPPALRATRAEIRLVPRTHAAAASGLVCPTVWIGERLEAANLELVLVHEICHVRRLDPLWTALIVALKRAYWWNPLVRHLAAEAAAMLESCCDQECARWLGRRRYLGGLAALLLSNEDRSPSLASAMRSGSNVLRLEVLSANAALRVRHVALLAVATSAAAFAVTVHALAGRAGAGPATSLSVATPSTPAERTLAALLHAVNDGDSATLAEYLNAFTPQETPSPFAGRSAMELVELHASGPNEVRYVITARHGAERLTGSLELAPSGDVRLTPARLDAPR
jgi:beta-lactamase regulating signal transducer with metallopeptidase domain